MRCGSATLLAGGAAGEQRERPRRSAAVPAAERSASDHAHHERLGLPAMAAGTAALRTRRSLALPAHALAG
ncbi:MAG TPA: hypothetical protein VH599_09170 [Ktedonobacterales bacterium]